MKKKALLSSILTIALCLSLIAGSTFALFTSEDSVNVAITSGKVDVVAEIVSDSVMTKQLNDVVYTQGFERMYGGVAELGNNGLVITQMVPGDGIQFNVQIENKSNVTIKYRTVLKAEGDTELLEALRVAVGEDIAEYDGTTIKTDWTEWTTAEAAIRIIPVTIEFPDAENNNEYRDITCKLYYTVEAVQGNAPDVWDGETSSDPEPDDEGVYHITNAAEFMALMDSFNDGEAGTWRGAYASSNIVLDDNIDLGGAIIERGIPSFFNGQFDGQNYTVSNFTLKRVTGAEDTDPSYAGRYTSLFGAIEGKNACVKNLTVKDATIVGQKGVSAIVTAVWGGGTVENCHVADVTLIGVDQVGAVVGYNGVGTVKDCSASNCDIYYSRTEGTLNENLSGDSLGVIGDNDATAIGCTKENVTVTNKAFAEVITGVADFNRVMAYSQSGSSSRYYGQNLILTCDIDLGGATITGFGNSGCIFGGSFDGNGHTVSNFKIDNAPEIFDTTYYAGLFNYYSYGTLENLTVNNAIVNGDMMIGALVGGVYDNATVKNCSVEDCTVIGYRKVGGAIGYGQYATVENVSVKNTNVYCKVAEQSHDLDQWGEVFGYKNTSLVEGTGENANTSENVTVVTGVTSVSTVSTAAQLATAIQNNGTVAVVLTDDIDGASWTSVGLTGDYHNTKLTIDGNGHSISGLTMPLLKSNAAKYLTVKNLTVKNSTISSLESNSLAAGGGVGAIIPYANIESVVLENCHLDNVAVQDVSGNYMGVGGFVGQNDGTNLNITGCTVKNCTISGGDQHTGAIVGQRLCGTGTSTISNCTVDGATTVTASEYAGRIVGCANGTGTLEIANCTYTGDACGRIVNATVNVQ